MSQEKINPKWLKRKLKAAMETSTYYTGTTPRMIALSIVKLEMMHPSYVGAIDQLIVKLMHEGKYAIVNSQLVRSDNVEQLKVMRYAKKQRRLDGRHQRQRSSRGYREFATGLHAEAYA